MKLENKWHLRLGLEIEDADHLVMNVEIVLSYPTYADLTIKLRLAKQLIENNSLESIGIEYGQLIYAEGINALTGASIKHLTR